MADGIDAAVKAVKTLILRSPLDRGGPEAKFDELGVGDHACWRAPSATRAASKLDRGPF